MRAIVAAVGNEMSYVTGSTVDAIDYYIECMRLGIDVALVVDSVKTTSDIVADRYGMLPGRDWRIMEPGSMRVRHFSKALFFASSPLHARRLGISADEATAILSRSSSARQEEIPEWIRCLEFGAYIKKMQISMLVRPRSQEKASYINVTSLSSDVDPRLVLRDVPRDLKPVVYAIVPAQMKLITGLIKERPDTAVMTGSVKNLFERFCHVTYVNDSSDYSPRMVVECAHLGIPVAHSPLDGSRPEDNTRLRLLAEHGPEYFDIRKGDETIEWLGE